MHTRRAPPARSRPPLPEQYPSDDRHDTAGFPPLSRARGRSFRRLRERKGRAEAGQFLAEGPQAVRAALAAPELPLAGLVADPDALRRHADLVAEVAARGVAVWQASPEETAALTEAVQPQGLVAICHQQAADLGAVLADQPRLIVLCAQVRDPGNAGTIIRSADAFGADAVVFSTGSVELYNPKVVRSTVGSLFNLPVSTGVDLAEAVAVCRAAGMQVLAADGRADRSLVDVDLSLPTAWLFGNEAWGLPEADAALADEPVAVPLYGRAESLNLAAAAAVCLFSSAQGQRR